MLRDFVQEVFYMKWLMPLSLHVRFLLIFLLIKSQFIAHSALNEFAGIFVCYINIMLITATTLSKVKINYLSVCAKTALYKK